MESNLSLVAHSTASKNGPMNMDLYKIKRREIESSHFRKLRTWSNGIFLSPFSINQCWYAAVVHIQQLMEAKSANRICFQSVNKYHI